MLTATMLPACLAADTLSSDLALSTEGYFVLSWELSDATPNPFLQQATNSSFRNSLDREIGLTGSLTITGLEDGNYYFRLHGESGPVGQPIQVSVKHHSLFRASLIFVLGFLLFAVLVLAIIVGSKQRD